MKDATLLQKIEAYLFYEGGSATVKSIAQITGAPSEDIEKALNDLSHIYNDNHGITVIRTESEVSLRIAPSCSSFIETLHKESLAKEIGPAALEVLGILMYRGKSSQADIDTIRGVNSAFSLRTLRMRGLITRLQEGSSTTYSISPEALAHLGVTSIDNIPQREEISQALATFEAKAHTAQDQTVAQVEGDAE